MQTAPILRISHAILFFPPPRHILVTGGPPVKNCLLRGLEFDRAERTKVGHGGAQILDRISRCGTDVYIFAMTGELMTLKRDQSSRYLTALVASKTILVLVGCRVLDSVARLSRVSSQLDVVSGVKTVINSFYIRAELAELRI